MAQPKSIQPANPLLGFFALDTLSQKQQVFLWMTALFLTCLIVANLIGGYLFSFTLPFDTPLGRAVLLSAGIIPFPVTFILTDLLNEFYGKHAARFVTLVGFIMSIVVFIFLWLGEFLPAYESSPFPREHYHLFSGLYTQIFVASLTAYLVGQLLDIQLFGVFKRLTQSKMIWLRAQGSTVISQLFDSFIVTFIAFGGGTLSTGEMVHLASSNYCWKFVIVVMITPLLYLGHFWVKKALQNPPSPPEEAHTL